MLRKATTTLLLLATAVLPAVAQAQQAPERDQRENRRPEGGRPGGDRPAGQPQAAAPQTAPQTAAPQNGGRPDGARPRDDRRDIGQNRGFGEGRGPGNGRGPGDGRGPGGDDRRDGRPDSRPDARPDNRDFRAYPGNAPNGRDDRRDYGDRRDGRGPGGPGYRGDPRYAGQGYNGPRGGYDPRGGGGWNNRWRDDRRYDWQGWRQSHRDAFRLPRYYAPRGYDYRRWSVGYRLDPFFYDQGYWIDDPYAYRLPPVYGPYRWVRYYDDVLLVDISNGLIRDVLYSFFWSR